MRRRYAVGFALVVATASAAVDEAKCLELGFTSSLRCSSCEKLATMVPDAELHAECQACCFDESTSKLFTSARLEVCK